MMRRLGLGIAAAVVVLDRLTKWAALARVEGGEPVLALAPFFNLVLVENPGITFGLLTSRSSWVAWLLVAVAAAIAAALITWLGRVDRAWLAAAIGLVLGGALGNVIDRVRYGAVIDFLDFHLSGYHWPAFNLADSAIVVGVGFMILDSLFARRESLK